MACRRLDSIAMSACRRITSSTSSIRSQQSALGNALSMKIQTSSMMPSSAITPVDTSLRNFHSTSIGLNQAKEDLKHSPKLEELFQKILYLDMVEIHLLTELINEKLGVKISDAEKERIARGGAGGGAKSSDAPKEESKEEQTAFDLKLTGFDAKAKIKVIKEVRAITGLGLKEAKELVEGVPSAVKKGIKKEEAEELKTKLEAVGATIEIS